MYLVIGAILGIMLKTMKDKGIHGQYQDFKRWN